jgi:hypothetical protein
MIRNQSAITLQLAAASGPATMALEQCLKRRRENNDCDKETTTKHHRSNHSNDSLSFNDMFESLASEVAGEASFPSIEWDFDDDE